MSIYSSYTVTSNFDMTIDGDYFDIYFIDASSNSITIDISSNTLYDGAHYKFIRIDTSLNTVTLAASGSGITINGGASILMLPGQYHEIIMCQNDWRVT